MGLGETGTLGEAGGTMNCQMHCSAGDLRAVGTSTPGDLYSHMLRQSYVFGVGQNRILILVPQCARYSTLFELLNFPEPQFPHHKKVDERHNLQGSRDGNNPLRAATSKGMESAVAAGRPPRSLVPAWTAPWAAGSGPRPFLSWPRCTASTQHPAEGKEMPAALNR